MEPIGQKTALTASEEGIVAAELVVEAGENEGDKIFNSTLDEMLAENDTEETLLEELLEEDGQDTLISTVNINQVDLENIEEKFRNASSDHAVFPLEIIEDTLLSEDSRSVQSHVLQKSVPIVEEMIELIDPRVVTEESNFENFQGSGVAETGLQSLLEDSSPDSLAVSLQTVFHQIKIPEDGAELSENDLQAVLNKSPNKAVQSEETVEISRSSLHTIMHKTGSESAQSDDEVVQSGNDMQSELKHDSVKQIQNHGNIAASVDIKSTKKPQEVNVKNQMNPVSSPGLSKNSQDAEIPIAANATKNMLAGAPQAKEQLKANESLQVVENIKANEGIQAKMNANEVEEFQDKGKSRFSDSLQITDKIKLAENSQNLNKTKTTEVLPTTVRLKVEENLQGLTKVKTAEILQPDEMFKTADELKGLTKVKTAEFMQAEEMFKTAEELKGIVKAKESFQTAGSNNTKVLIEKGTLAPMNQFRTLAAKDTKLSGNVNTGVESVFSPGLNVTSETSGSSIYKTPESANVPAETMRATDLPFDMQQLVSRVRILRGNGIEEMTLRLHPEELGNITLKVRQSGGDLLIDMRVDNPLAKQLVESGYDLLRSKFLDQEFAYKDLALNVDINQRDSQFGSDRQYEEFEDEMFSAQRGKEQEISTLEETPRVRHRTDSGLNLYV
jgi:flagellar hook-length control protein FliK